MGITVQIDEIIACLRIAEKSSFKAAAEELFVSQPALSRRIERLEAAIGTQLLERTTWRVSLTRAGEQFLPHAHAALEELELAIRSVSETTVQRGALVTVACVPTVAAHLLPSVLKAFSSAHPNARVKTIDEGAAQVLDSVVSGSADFGVSFTGAQQADIEFGGIRSEHFLLAMPRSHRLAARTAVSWDDLAAESFIAVAGTSGNRALIDNALAKASKRPPTFYEASHIASAMGMVRASLGVAAVSGLAFAGNTYPDLVGIALHGPRISRTIGLIWRKGNRLHPTAAALLDMLRAALARPARE